jgi:hypothetical protein
VDPSLCSRFRAKLAAVTKRLARTAPLVGLLALAGLTAFATDAPQPPDPLAAEIARWKAFAAIPGHSGEIWDSVRQGGEPLLLRAEQALADGRRLLALQRLAAAHEGFYAARYLYGLGAAERQDPARFEAEWRRVGEQLKAELAPPAADTLSGVGPAAVRAIGEAALPQVRVYYEASLDYGQNTVLDSGLYYIGSALAQRELAGLVRAFSAPAAAAPPPLRSLAPELAALEKEVLAAYRPPASIDRHSDFIRASAALKEAHELDALGLRYGALLRYLQAAQRFAPVRGAPAGPGIALEARLREYDARLASRERDDTIGRLFLETAQSLAGTGKDQDPALALAIADFVLPKYFAALEPPKPAAKAPEPRATVTLVRWPYT